MTLVGADGNAGASGSFLGHCGDVVVEMVVETLRLSERTKSLEVGLTMWEKRAFVRWGSWLGIFCGWCGYRGFQSGFAPITPYNSEPGQLLT